MKTFNPLNAVLTFRAHICTGFAADSMVTFAMNSDTYNYLVDAYGRTSRYKINDNTGILTVKLTQASPSNDILTGYYLLDRNTDNGKGELFFRDNSGTTQVHALEAFILGVAELDFGVDGKIREWVFCCPEADYFAGGLTT
jgi:hypothetical protein